MEIFSRRDFLRQSLAAAGGLLAARRSWGADDFRPNIVFIMADDLGCGDPHCYNPESRIPTPNMDSLAAQGMLFTDAHSPASVCTPSRYAVLTGRYCWRTWLKKQVLWTTFDEPLIEKGRPTVADLARDKGYATACIGKWHLGMNFYKKSDKDEFARGKRWHKRGKGGVRDVDFSRAAARSPNDAGFDYSFVSGAGHNMEPHCFIRNRMPATPPTEWREAKTPTLPDSSGRESHEGWMSPGWVDERVDLEFMRQAVDFIEGMHRDSPGKPFFLYMTPVAPHRPCVPNERFKGVTGVGLREDFVAQLDWIIGQVVDKLDELGLTENTLLMVTSDNGAVGGSGGHESAGKFRGRKGQLFEGGHRVPLIARWPGHIEPGTICDTPVCTVGLPATCADIFGAELPRDAFEDSFSFLPALLGQNSSGFASQGIVHHSFSGKFGIRLGDWKLLPGNDMLFNMAKDPYERENLFEQYPEKAELLSGRLAEIRESGRSRD